MVASPTASSKYTANSELSSVAVTGIKVSIVLQADGGSEPGSGLITIISPANKLDTDKNENTINKDLLIKFEIFIHA
jgi:hypothetical protein